jgi:tetratricopeptide (TPR) repeat protein
MRISLCMIVRDEAQNLAHALVPALALVDQIVVVDTGSSDDTRRVAHSIGAEVFEFQWCDDFSAARNESIRHAHGEWIFWLDGDDRIPRHSIAKLRELFGALDDPNVAYLMRVVSSGADGLPVQETSQVRLFRNDARIRWDYRVHEQIMPALHRIDGHFVETGIEIAHTGYMCDRQVLGKLERNLRLLDLDLNARPFDGHLLSCRAAALVDSNRAAEALVSIHFWEAAHTQYRMPVSLRVLKARAFATEERLPEALDCIRAGLVEYPEDSKLAFVQAQILGALGDTWAAERCLREQLTCDQRSARYAVIDRTIADFRIRHLLAEILLLEGRTEEAVQEAGTVTRKRPAYGPAWLTLAEAAVALPDVAAIGAIRARFVRGSEARIVQIALTAFERRMCGDLDGAIAAMAQAPTGHPALAAVRAQLLFDGGARGETLTTALRLALEHDPFCVRARALQRSLLGFTSTATSRTSDHFYGEGASWARGY